MLLEVALGVLDLVLAHLRGNASLLAVAPRLEARSRRAMEPRQGRPEPLVILTAVAGLVLLSWWLLALASGADAYEQFVACATHPLGYVVMVGLTYFPVLSLGPVLEQLGS